LLLGSPNLGGFWTTGEKSSQELNSALELQFHTHS
jgi:hypothetical protein